MGPIGMPEMIVIFILALVLFGPKKLPEIGRTVGKAVTEFRRASSELKATFQQEMQTLEQETQSIKEATTEYQYDSYNYDYSSYDANMEGTHGETSDSSAADPSTESASAPQGAESPSATEPEGVVAYGSGMQANPEHTGEQDPIPAGDSTPARSQAEHNT